MTEKLISLVTHVVKLPENKLWSAAVDWSNCIVFKADLTAHCLVMHISTYTCCLCLCLFYFYLTHQKDSQNRYEK